MGIIINHTFGTALLFPSVFLDEKQMSPFFINHPVTLLLAHPPHPVESPLPRCASRSADESLIHARLVRVITV